VAAQSHCSLFLTNRHSAVNNEKEQNGIIVIIIDLLRRIVFRNDDGGTADRYGGRNAVMESSSPFRLDDATTTMTMMTTETEPDGAYEQEQDKMEDLSNLTNNDKNHNPTAFLDVHSTTFPLPETTPPLSQSPSYVVFGGEYDTHNYSLEGSASLPPPPDETTGRPLWGQKRVRNHLIAPTTTDSVMKKKPRMGIDFFYPESQHMLMNEPIEHDYDALIATTAAASLQRRQHQQRLASHKAAFGAARKDIFDDDDDAVEHNDEHGGGAPTASLPTEPRVGLDSWQMHVLHRMIQKLPLQPQAAFQSIAARAIDRHMQGEVKYDHLPGSIFEDVMAAVGTGTEQYANLFLETYIAVRNEMHPLENVHATALQLAMGYAYVLGMRHAQTRSAESALDDTLLDRAKAEMNDVPPSERCRVWSEFVALARSSANDSVDDDNDDDIPR
jgi:hypothetical protein